VARRRSVPAGAPRNLAAALAALTVIATAAPVAAAPKSMRAKVAFERGVKAYKAGDYASAAAAFDESLDAESDTETMFALAQAERQLGKCETAIGLYDKLLGGTLPAANRTAVEKAKSECAEILANERRAAGANGSGSGGGSGAGSDDSGGSGDADTGSDDRAVVVAPAPGDHVWWQEPVGDVLTGFGLAGLGVSAGFLLEAQNAADARDTATSDIEYRREQQREENDHDAAVIAGVAGGVLFVAGVSWYLTHRGDDAPRHRRHRQVSGWLDGGGGGGFAVVGVF
jgi:tetratricopeptide (TPR) repeat protein